MAFVIGDARFHCDRGHQERALVAKFRPHPGARPVFLICGHTSMANRAAVHFLYHRYEDLAASLASTERFCVVIRVDGIETFGHESASLETDITDAAFTRSA